MKWVRACISPLSFCVLFVVTLTILFGSLASRTYPVAASTASAATTEQVTVFTNPAAIAPADRASNNAGTNPGVPAVNYPSPIMVTGLTGTITKVTVTFAVTSTFPDDLDILLVGPTGAMSLVMSDAGGSGDPNNVSYTWDQAAAGLMPDSPTTIVPTGTYQPSNYVGFVTPEPGGQDNFPGAGGLMNYPTTFNIFNGTNPNGTWNLYVVDDQVIDLNSLPSGWSIDITTTGVVAADAPMDVNGDGKSDYVVVRNVGGGPSGQVRWFYNANGTGAATGAADWGIATDFFMMEDFDGDNKDDIAVWRPMGPPAGAAAFYILQSATSTARVDVFGQPADDPTVVGDYDGDGKADVAVYRAGASSGQQSTWFYRGSLTPGIINYVPWGLNGDFEVPGDFDGDGKFDFVVQRNNGGGQARFWRRFATGTTDSVVFGTPTDVVVPGDYDGDAKADIATVRAAAGSIQWQVLSSLNGSITFYTFGLSATDFVTQGDFDGDGKVEPAVWRPNADPTMCFFFSRNSTNGAVQWFELGQNGDYPVGNYNAH